MLINVCYGDIRVVGYGCYLHAQCCLAGTRSSSGDHYVCPCCVTLNSNPWDFSGTVSILPSQIWVELRNRPRNQTDGDRICFISNGIVYTEDRRIYKKSHGDVKHSMGNIVNNTEKNNVVSDG